MKLYNKLFIILITLGVLFGFVLPFLISSNSNELTILGFIIILGLIYKLGQIIVRHTKE